MIDKTSPDLTEILLKLALSTNQSIILIFDSLHLLVTY